MEGVTFENQTENHTTAYLRRPVVLRSEDPKRLALHDGLLDVWRAGRSGETWGPNITNLVGQLAGLDLQALSSSIVSVVQRHDILTARVEETADGAYLYLDEGFVPQIEVIDLGESSRKAEEIAKELVWQPFEVDPESGRSGPLMRAFVVLVSADRSIFGIVVHHVIADFLSTAIIGRDVSRFYEDYVNGKIPHHSAPSVNFIDHTINFEAWLASPAGKMAAAHWRAKVLAESPTFMIPPDGGAPGSTNHESLSFTVPMVLSREMRKFARTRKIKLFTLCLAAQLLAIMRATGEEQGLIYIDHFGRDQARLFNVVGCFAWIVPTRVSLHGTQNFEQVVSRVERDCEDLFKATPIPVHTLGLSVFKDGPVFNFVDCAADINGGLFSVPLTIPWPERAAQGYAGFHHSLVIERTSEGLVGSVHYGSYSEQTMREFVIDVLTLLAAGIHKSDQHLDELCACCKLAQSRRVFEKIFR